MNRSTTLVLAATLVTTLAPGAAVGSSFTLPARLEPAPDGRSVVAHDAAFALTIRADEAIVDGTGAEPIRIRLVGADASARLIEDELLPGHSSYFTGSDPSQWRTCVPHLAKVRYASAWPGIDVAWSIRGDVVETDYLLAPGSNVRDVVIAVTGARSIGIVEGELVIATASGALRLQAPVAWETTGGGNRDLASSFVALGGMRFGLTLDGRDVAKPAVIDPVLQYSTFMGAPRFSHVYSVLPLEDGSAWYLGFAMDGDFTGFGTRSRRSSFLARLGPGGDELLDVTFIDTNAGGGGNFVPQLAVDDDGFIFISGIAADGWPLVGGIQDAPVGGADVLLVKLAPDASSILWSRYFGGTGHDETVDLAVDHDGNPIVVGRTMGGLLPTVNAIQSSPGNPEGMTTDGFVAKFSSDGRTVLFSSYLCGSLEDGMNAVGVDGGDNIVVVGYTNSPEFPWPGSTGESCDPSCHGCYVARIPPEGGHFAYCTRFEDAVLPMDVAVEPLGRAVVLGWSAGGATLVDPFDDDVESIPPTQDAYLAWIAPTGEIEKASYLGGPGIDNPVKVVLDAWGRVLVMGYSTFGFPLVDAPSEPVPNPEGTDVFIARIAADFSGIEYSTHFGGTGSQWDIPSGLAAGSDGSAYLCGVSHCPDFPTTPDALEPDPLFDDAWEVGGFAMRFGTGEPNVREPSAVDLRDVPPLTVLRPNWTQLVLGWEETFGNKQGLYAGTIESLWQNRRYDHQALACDLASTGHVVPMPAGNAYFLVVDRLNRVESSYGRDSYGRERPAATVPCR